MAFVKTCHTFLYWIGASWRKNGLFVAILLVEDCLIGVGWAYLQLIGKRVVDCQALTWHTSQVQSCRTILQYRSYKATKNTREAETNAWANGLFFNQLYQRQSGSSSIYQYSCYHQRFHKINFFRDISALLRRILYLCRLHWLASSHNYATLLQVLWMTAS